jgi:hypothetical protein
MSHTAADTQRCREEDDNRAYIEYLTIPAPGEDKLLAVIERHGGPAALVERVAEVAYKHQAVSGECFSDAAQVALGLIMDEPIEEDED